MPKYSNGKIYTIRFTNDDNSIYIGSTTQSLAVRFGGHKKVSKNSSSKCSLYRYIQETYNGNWSLCYIELYEDFECDNREQLNKREGEIIRLFRNDYSFNVINKNIAGRTPQEYKMEWNEKFQDYQKQYHNTHKEELLKKKKEYYEKKREQILEYKKEYRENNKEKIKECQKAYRERNKEKSKERNKAYREKTKEHEKHLFYNKSSITK